MLRIPQRCAPGGGLGAVSMSNFRRTEAEEAWLKARAPRPQASVTVSRCLEKGGHLTGRPGAYNCVTVTRGRSGFLTTTEPVRG